MKTELTTEQSQHLIDLGVPKNKATEVIFNPNNNDYDFVFSLTDFLNGEIIPKFINDNDGYGDMELVMTYSGSYDWDKNKKAWWTYYDGCTPTELYYDDELIDSLYKLICWYYGEYLKSEEK